MLRDDIRDVVMELNGRRARVVLLVLALSLSTGALDAGIEIGRTASAQIRGEMAGQILDEITVMSNGTTTSALPDDAEQRALALDLVQAAGLRVDLDGALGAPRRPGQDQAPAGLVVLGATSNYLAAIDAEGVPEAAWVLDGNPAADHALLGTSAATRLGIPQTIIDSGYSVQLGGREYAVVGVLPDTGRRDLSNAIVIPYERAVTLLGSDATTRMIVRTELGAGANVAAVIRETLRPDAPTSLKTSRVSDLRNLRRGVETQLDRLVTAVGVLLVALTALLITNAMVVSVVSRTSEIGLRRALGASRLGITRLFLVEGGLVGILGGLGGAALGSWAVVVVSWLNGWGLTLSAWVPPAAVLLGLTVGIVASVVPARRAAAIDPAQAVRMD